MSKDWCARTDMLELALALMEEMIPDAVRHRTNRGATFLHMMAPRAMWDHMAELLDFIWNKHGRVFVEDLVNLTDKECRGVLDMALASNVKLAHWLRQYGAAEQREAPASG